MTESDIGLVIYEALMTVLIASSPILITALLVGLFVAFFQALTQVQEMTLTFVPKIVAIFIALMLSMSFMFTTLDGFTDRIFDLIVSDQIE